MQMYSQHQKSNCASIRESTCNVTKEALGEKKEHFSNLNNHKWVNLHTSSRKKPKNYISRISMILYISLDKSPQHVGSFMDLSLSFISPKYNSKNCPPISQTISNFHFTYTLLIISDGEKWNYMWRLSILGTIAFL